MTDYEDSVAEERAARTGGDRWRAHDMAHDVFLSYAHQDKNAADAVVAHVERAGIRCWVAPRDVAPGSAWAAAIVAAIEGARIVVVVFSGNTNESEHVCREIGLAIKRGVTVVPVRIEDAAPRGEIEFFLSSAHWLDAITPPMERHLESLAARLGAMLDRAAPASATLAPAGQRWRWRGPGPTLVLAAAAVALCLLVWKSTGLASAEPKAGAAATEVAASADEESARFARDVADYQEFTLRTDSAKFLVERAPLRLRAWQRRAEAGDPWAQTFVSLCLFDGIAVEPDGAAALEWVRKAADQMLPVALNVLAYAYSEGTPPLARDEEQAIRLYREAANMGWPRAMTNLAHYYRWGGVGIAPDAKQVVSWYQAAIDKGAVYAVRMLADLYANGMVGLAKDVNRANELYRKAAAAGDKSASGMLAAARLVESFEQFAASGGAADRRAKAVEVAQRVSAEHVDDLPVESKFTLLEDYRLKDAIAAIRADTDGAAMLAVYTRTIEQLVDGFGLLSLRDRRAGVRRFTSIVADSCVAWRRGRDYRRLVRLWETCLKDVDLSGDLEGERDGMVRALSACVLALIHQARFVEAETLQHALLAMADGVLAKRPWDWYLKDALAGFCGDAAAAWHGQGQKQHVQPLLRRMWSRHFTMYGRQDLERLTKLPLKGVVPEGLEERDADFFRKFTPGYEGPSGLKRFTIQVGFGGGEKYPWYVYIPRGVNGYRELQEQFRWVTEYRGGVVPVEVEDSMRRLLEIAVENNVDFMELCVFALGTAAAEGGAQEQPTAEVEAR